MDKPFKIIHKFKNVNRHKQYLTYIFIGNIDKEIIDILEKIKNFSLIETLQKITKKDYSLLNDFYGDFWYEFFFNNYHLLFSKSQIIRNESLKKEIIQKYGNDWFVKHLKNYQTYRKQLLFNYASTINYKLQLREKTQVKVKVEDFLLNQKTTNVIDLQNIDLNQTGGADEEEEEEIIDVESDAESELDLNELSQLYQNLDKENEKTIEKTANLIEKAVDDINWEKKIEKKMIKFDETLNDLTFDNNLKDIYKKEYITDQFIYRDDTIKIIKNKIALSIQNSTIFDNNYLIPSRQYLWSEYPFNQQIEKVMIGQKWIYRNELLKINIEPSDNINDYLNLKDKLKLLYNNVGYRLKYEDDENLLIEDYAKFITCNEIYLLDIYNELGINFEANVEQLKNLYNVYISIYFPNISLNYLEEIVKFLNKKDNLENPLIEKTFLTIQNDMKLENEIMTLVEETKKTPSIYQKFFNPNYILQSIIHVNLRPTTQHKKNIDLYRIFDSFIVNNTYPFIQYQAETGNITYKFYSKTEKIDDKDVLYNWFESAPYGISFKIKFNNKYLSVNLHQNYRMEYKATWKEDENATIEQVKETYQVIRDLLEKINKETSKMDLIIPEESRFNFAFINTIQQFMFPQKQQINHNDLSEFARYFFPYVALQIEPRKRVAKKGISSEASKYGTYMRYKRVSNYENRKKIHLRIIYFMRNFSFSDKELEDEISKQFNLTIDVAREEINFVKEKYGSMIAKARRILKKMENLPKGKPPGIGFDIQGRDPERYKIRITGAKDKDQLDDIINFGHVLIYLYYETYILKKSFRQKLKEKLNLLTNIAKRRNKVQDIVIYDTPIKSVKKMISLDKSRLGFKPEKGQSQYTRACQNSGDKIRRPNLIQESNLQALFKLGYKLNQKTGFYEREVKISGNKTTIRAVKLKGDNGNLFYVCSPEVNGEYSYVGFLTKSNHPSGICMPCCFKIDQLTGDNKDKKEFFQKCIGQIDPKKEERSKSLNKAEQLYILQDTNKIHDERFVFLTPDLDFFFNKTQNLKYQIKNHYLTVASEGYYFKYTLRTEPYYFLGGLSIVLNKTIEEILKTCIDALLNDKKNNLFYYLQNGKIAEEFQTKENFIDYLRNNTYLEPEIVYDLVSLPNILTPSGFNIYLLKKIETINQNDTIIDYQIQCLNPENAEEYLSLSKPNYLFIKEDKYYFPIIKLTKKTSKSRNFTTNTAFLYSDDDKNIINMLNQYYKNACLINILHGDDYSSLHAKNLILLLKNTKIKTQYIDVKYKCRYLLTQDDFLIPTLPSGIIYHINIDTNIFNLKPKKLNDTLQFFKKLNLSQFKILSLFYNNQNNDKYQIVSIEFPYQLVVPVIPEFINKKDFDIPIKFKPISYFLDELLLKETKETNEIIVNNKFIKEGYQLYRLETSNYLNKNPRIKEMIMNNLKNKEKLLAILYYIGDKDLYNQFTKKYETDKINIELKNNYLKINDKLTINKNYIPKNIREICFDTKLNKCNDNPHCIVDKNHCLFNLDQEMLINYTNRLVNDFIQLNRNAKEVLLLDDYFVQDIINTSLFTERTNQKIIKPNEYNLQNFFKLLFGNKKEEDEWQEINTITSFGDYYEQNIFENNNSIYRGLANGLYWIRNKYSSVNFKNLGYISSTQTDLSNFLKAEIINYYFKNQSNIDLLLNHLNLNLDKIKDIAKKLKDSVSNKFDIIIIFAFVQLYQINVVILNTFNQIQNIITTTQIISSNEIKKNENKYQSYLNKSDSIYLKFNYISGRNVADKITIIYFN